MRSIEKFYYFYLALQDEVRLRLRKTQNIFWYFARFALTLSPMSQKTLQDILVKRNSMLSESPPRNKRVIVNLIESVPMLRRGLSHIRFTACGEPRQRMTKVCAFLFY